MNDTHPPFFIFDVESVGLHGEAFAVAGGVYLANGAAQWEFRYACPIDEAKGDDEGRKWTKENVAVLDVTHRLPIGIRDAFWLDWLKARAQYPNIVMAAECGWPVEARFLCAVIDDEPEDRRWKGPYPLHEISSYLVAAGMDPMATYKREESEKPPHEPLADARLSARLLATALRSLRPRDERPWKKRVHGKYSRDGDLMTIRSAQELIDETNKLRPPTN